MSIEQSYSKSTLMSESARVSTQRQYFYFEGIFPSGVKYTVAERIAHALSGEWTGISASQQLSAQEMEELVRQLPNRKFTIVDLREETHFFLNGASVSLTNTDNNLNEGKQLPEIREEEYALIEKITQQGHAVLHTRKKEKILTQGAKEKTIVFSPHAPTLVQDILTEEMLVDSLNGNYVRIPITDHEFPSETQIDALISLYETQQKESSWIHFHCAAGRGRSSVALSIFAILNWARHHSLIEIFQHLESRGNRQLLKPVKAGKPIKQRSDSAFWEEFYRFASERKQGMKWSDWKKQVVKL